LVPALVHSNLTGVASIEAATGATFADLYRRWSLALGLEGRGSQPASLGAADDGFLSVNIRSPWEDWELAGPRITRLTPGGPPVRWSAPGTSTHFLVVERSPTGAAEIQVMGPKEAELQVTAVPLAPDRARLDLALRPRYGPDGKLRVWARVEERHGVPVRLSALSWERITPGSNPNSGEFHCGRLDMLGIASVFGTSAIPGHGALESQPIHIEGVSRQTGPLVVKVVGTDPQGRRVSAWADLNTDQTLHSSDP
jgi:hypothetical protein